MEAESSLTHLRSLLDQQGHPSRNAARALLSLNGFHPDLVAAAGRRSDILLVDVRRLYGEERADTVNDRGSA